MASAAPFNVLSICAGVAGLDLGIGLAIPTARTVCVVEREAYCVETLATRGEEEALAPAPVWSDLRTFDGRPWRGVVDLLAAGIPCQPHSVAGKRLGAADAECSERRSAASGGNCISYGSEREGEATGLAFSDAIIQRPCPKCGCSAGFYCEVPSGRKRTAPHNARVIFTADNRRGLNPRPTELSE